MVTAMKRKKIILALSGLLMIAAVLVSCATEPSVPMATPTVVNPGEIALTMIMQKMDAEATQMMVNVQFTATAQVIAVTSTRQAYEAAIATDQQTRKDAQATDARQRQDVAATEQRKRDDAATEQAHRDAEATAEQYQQNVIGTATAQQAAIWNAATMQVMPTHNMWTKQAVEQEQKIATNQVELSNLEVERQQKSNTLQALGPYMVAFIAVIVGALVMVRYSRTREIKNEETGAIEAIFLDSRTMIRPQLLPGPVLDLTGKTPSVPLLTDSANQAEIVRRSQMAEALRAMPTQAPTQMAAGMMSSVFGGETPSRFQILDEHEAPPAQLLDAEALKSLEHDWKEKSDEQL